MSIRGRKAVVANSVRGPATRGGRVDHARRWLNKLQDAENCVRSQNSHLNDLQLTELVRHEKDKSYRLLLDRVQPFIERSGHPERILHRYLIDRIEQYYMDMLRSPSKDDQRLVLKKINVHATMLLEQIDKNTLLGNACGA